MKYIKQIFEPPKVISFTIDVLGCSSKSSDMQRKDFWLFAKSESSNNNLAATWNNIA